MSASVYRYTGAEACIRLHEQHLRAFWQVWQRAEAEGLTWPAAEDPDYASRAHLLRHVLGAARHYMVWMCRVLGQPDPAIPEAPGVEAIVAQGSRYLEQVLDGWRGQLSEVPEERFHRETFDSAWGVPYCVDAMLEHAVMHPIRHAHQLERWLPSEAQA